MESRDSVLYVVDARIPVLERCLDMVSRAIRDAAQQSLYCDAGVVLYNVQGQPKKTKTLLSLGVPKIDDLKAFIRLASNATLLARTIEASEGEDSLLNVLREVKSELNQLRFRSMRRVVLITANSDPFRGDKQKLNVATNLTSDITNSPALINPIFVKYPEFNVSTFWGSLHYLPPFYKTHFTLFDPLTKFALDPVSPESLSSSNHSLVLSKSRRKHFVLRGRLQIRGLSIGVKGFNIVQPRARVPTARDVAIFTSKTGSERRELLQTELKHAIAASGSEIELQSSQLNRAFKLSGSMNESDWTVNTSEEEWARLHHLENSEDTVLEVEYFAAASDLAQLQGAVIGHSNLLVPNDDRFENSLDAFAALHRSMVRKDVAAIIRIHYPKHRKAPPVLGVAYAKNPEPKVFPDQKELLPTAASGLYFVPLPFSDDFRVVNSTFKGETDDELNAGCMKLVHKFRLPYGFDPYRFPHPRAAQFASILEHHTLSIPLETKDNKLVEQPDPTKPRYEKIIKSARELLHHLAERYASSGKLSTSPPRKTKKRTHVEALDLSILADDLRSNRLDKYTVASILETLQALGAPSKRDKKAILLDKLKWHIRQKISDVKSESP